MTRDMLSSALKLWAGENNNKVSMLNAMEAAVYFVGICVLNPLTYKALALFSSDDLSLITTIVILVMAIVYLIMATAAFGSLIEVRERLNKDFNKKVESINLTTKKVLDVNVLAANKILAQNHITLLPKSSSVSTVYQVAETKNYVLNNHLINHNYKSKIMIILLLNFLINIPLGLITGGINWFFTLGYAALLIVISFLLESFIAMLLIRKSRISLRKVAEIYKKKIRIWIEYQFRLMSYENSNGVRVNRLIVTDESIQALQDANNVKNTKNLDIENTLNALKKLCDESYKTIQLINDNDCDAVATAGNEVHIKNIEKITEITKSYIPACAQQIKKSLSSAARLDNTLASPYRVLMSNIEEQERVVLGMQFYYKNIINNNILNEFQEVIDNQANGWLVDKEEAYSLKTAVLNKNINGKLIPELKALMAHADIETKIRIDGKIKDITEFFNQQVALEKQEASAMMLDYDKTVLITAIDGAITQKNTVEEQLNKIDFYIDELRRNW